MFHISLTHSLWSASFLCKKIRKLMQCSQDYKNKFCLTWTTMSRAHTTGWFGGRSHFLKFDSAFSLVNSGLGQGLLCLMPLSTIFQLYRDGQLVLETGVPGENHRTTASHWLTLLHNAVSSTPHNEWDSNSGQKWNASHPAFLNNVAQVYLQHVMYDNGKIVILIWSVFWC